MVKREFTFPSADGKTAIHAVEWLPEGAPRAVLQIAHAQHLALLARRTHGTYHLSGRR